MTNLASQIANSELSRLLRSCGFKDRRLDRTIKFLAQIHELFDSFRNFRKTVRASKSFSIVRLDPPPLVKLHKSKIDFDSILKDLGVPIEQGSPDCLRQDYYDTQARGLRAHAEIQLVLYAMETGIGEFYPYIGCTLPSCFLCSKFLGSLCQPEFRTRGTHGRLYPRWTVPTTPNIPLGTISDIERSLKAVYEHVKLMLEAPIAKNHRLISPTGGTSPIPQHGPEAPPAPIQPGSQAQPTATTQNCENCPLRKFGDARALAQHCQAKNHRPVAPTGSTTQNEPRAQPTATTQHCENCPRKFEDAGALAQHCQAKNHRPVTSTGSTTQNEPRAQPTATTQSCENCPLRKFRDADALAQHCQAKNHRPAASTGSTTQNEPRAQPTVTTQHCENCPLRKFRDADALAQHCQAKNHGSEASTGSTTQNGPGAPAAAATLRCENCLLSRFRDAVALAQHWSAKNHGPVAPTGSTATPSCGNCPLRRFEDAGALAQHCVALGHSSV